MNNKQTDDDNDNDNNNDDDNDDARLNVDNVAKGQVFILFS